ncbi:unnamed protein product (macronuclear) [Paramecium tetraurelia]|uniref:Anaphase-promoting complex subunit 4 WD40 domain-containing protein n=1 Tax=Paramecium tetraurelia TaxID=5888 RepID=A0CYQ0_PARTE|nr:uncharacterized protein GSPATT00011518001 [Paramecium tetraurelia]CAK75917.1 unnamed protein product [Paramecium tetraurelia]|eukprot:XP_001443314.1 hypothetical protein (macronuclear) [Paramecium tetraurelia strain d4-2]
MKKRNQKLSDLCVTSKVLCARFGTYTKQLIAAGDEKNSVQIWQIGNQKPIAVLLQYIPRHQVHQTLQMRKLKLQA